MQTKNINNQNINFYFHDTVVIGTGCAGFNSADTLFDMGKEVAIITEGVNMGTSRNTGSDKQTYYKLSLCSDSSDSIFELAENLFAGGSVHGDIALVEAACSVRSFMKLVNLGVPFPTNIYGEYVGYKTDHDPKQRATSCGPLTSKIMTEKLERSVKNKNIPIYDRMQAVCLITENEEVKGIIALDLANDCAVTVFVCNNVILATGGPAIVYKNSVYPHSQTGMSGLALTAGAKACNLQEWQYGLASTKFRWNVSGTYQQVIPRYISVDKDGNEREFLLDYFDNPVEALDMVFLKGYQWPFDTNKIHKSSIIDIIVHNEVFAKGNRVFMDFTKDPTGIENFESLSEETYEYLRKSEALIKTPIKRLEKMNSQAIELYKSHGIDITKEPLEISVCSQHCNGGIAVDKNWETCVKSLYVVGEAAGTFGISRPGGSALNSTQVGSLRAALHISRKKDSIPQSLCDYSQVEKVIADIDTIKSTGEQKNYAFREDVQSKMSLVAGHIRDTEKMKALGKYLQEESKVFFDKVSVNTAIDVANAFKTMDMMTVAKAMLSAMSLTANTCYSRGSALVLDKNATKVSDSELLQAYNFKQGNASNTDKCVETVVLPNEVKSEFVEVRPLVKTDDWFENVWKEFSANM